MPEAVIVSAARSPIGRANKGSLKDLRPDDLTATIIKTAVDASAVARRLIEEDGHHRITIDPAADNEHAISAYEKVGFRRVGTMRRYQRMSDGTWIDGLLMELLADELID